MLGYITSTENSKLAHELIIMLAMVEEADQPQNYHRSVSRVVESANYCCQYCGSGAGSFKEAFPDGCAKCGAPAQEFDKETVVREFPDLSQSFFVIHGDDTKIESEKFIGELRTSGAKVITLEDVLPNGIATHQVSEVLEKVATGAARVIFVPSQQLERSAESQYTLNIVSDAAIRTGEKRAIPAYVDADHIQYAPDRLTSSYGIFLDDNSPRNGVGVNFFLESQLPKMLDQIQTKK